MGSEIRQMKLEKKSPFRMGWLMAMFDLPVLLDEERKEANRFRKALLDDGFIKIQYSVYLRPCVSIERMTKYCERVKSYAPLTGEVRLLFFTDRQWGTIKIISKAPKKLEKIPEQVEFFSELMKDDKMRESGKSDDFLII